MTLTIDASVVIKAGSPGIGMRVDGELIANGTAVSPVVFTSLQDDSFGGDTNGDGSATSPARGDWLGIGAFNASTATQLDHVIVRFGGGGEWNQNFGPANIYTQSDQPSSLTITDSTIEESAGAGVWLTSASFVDLTENIVANNATYGVWLRNPDSNTFVGNAFHGNELYGMFNSTATPVIAENNFWGHASG